SKRSTGIIARARFDGNAEVGAEPTRTRYSTHGCAVSGAVSVSSSTRTIPLIRTSVLSATSDTDAGSARTRARTRRSSRRRLTLTLPIHDPITNVRTRSEIIEP